MPEFGPLEAQSVGDVMGRRAVEEHPKDRQILGIQGQTRRL